MRRRGNVQHGQARRYVSLAECVYVGVLVAVFLAGMIMMVAPSIGGI